MSQVTKNWWILIASVIAFCGYFLYRFDVYWGLLSMSERAKVLDPLSSNLSYFLLALILLLGGTLAGYLYLIFGYVLPAKRLHQEILTIQPATSLKPIRPGGAKYYREVGSVITEYVNRLVELQQNIENEILYSTSELEKEKNVLSLFVGGLREGVIICTPEGTILFFNQIAKELLEAKGDGGGISFFSDKSYDGEGVKPVSVDVGNSIFSLIDKNLILNTLLDVMDKVEKNGNDPIVPSGFVMGTQAGRFLSIETSPLLGKTGQLSGFVFLFKDVTELSDRDYKLDKLIQTLMQDIRGSVGGIRTSVETLMEYPDMDQGFGKQLYSIIDYESKLLTEIADKAIITLPQQREKLWRLVPVVLDDIMEAVRRAAADRLGITLYIESTLQKEWILAERYCAKMVFLFVLDRLSRETFHTDFFCKAEKDGTFLNIYFSWQGQSVSVSTLKEWNEESLKVNGEGFELSLGEALDNHNANLWFHCPADYIDRSAIRIYFPIFEKPE